MHHKYWCNHVPIILTDFGTDWFHHIISGQCGEWNWFLNALKSVIWTKVWWWWKYGKMGNLMQTTWNQQSLRPWNQQQRPRMQNAFIQIRVLQRLRECLQANAVSVIHAEANQEYVCILCWIHLHQSSWPRSTSCRWGEEWHFWLDCSLVQHHGWGGFHYRCALMHPNL